MKTQFNRNTCCAAAAVFAAISTFAFTGLMLDGSLDRAYARLLPAGVVETCRIPAGANVVEIPTARLADVVARAGL